MALFVIVLLIASGVLAWLFGLPFLFPSDVSFSGEIAYRHVEAQTAFGPRVVGSEAHERAGDYIESELRRLGWEVKQQPFIYRGVALRNFIGKAGVGRGPIVIVGAHYDSRRRADQDQERPNDPVPGANDGASGVAVLLELARSLDKGKLQNEVWLAFFDAEDDGGLDGWEWIVGSTYMANALTVTPAGVIVVDMVGDADQQIYLESNSDPTLAARLWTTAAGLGYGSTFIPTPKYSMLDDHTPFAQRGIPAVDIIDFDYPYWHTTHDTPDKVSPASLTRVGRTLESLLELGILGHSE